MLPLSQLQVIKPAPSFLSNAIFIGNLRHPATRSFLFLTTLSIQLWRPELVQIDPTAFLKALQNKPHSNDWVFNFLANEIPFIGGIWLFLLSAHAGTEF